ncbi:hypothetical protein [Ramlibacter humi]|uniref:Uncharacterized protein n=1 Tax=Ramlibacter humi TaxID=2530451 RepID=A0A4Z0BBU6_9BURK|nr:hypothetical protein [Ramlibacter humi]TFY96652.1 hypothetical protein EZ216_19900 [Ramlibacter humi]
MPIRTTAPLNWMRQTSMRRRPGQKEDLQLLQHLVDELRLFVSIYGQRSSQQRDWARRCLPAEFVGAFMTGWKEGRRQHWSYLQLIAARLRADAGEESVIWALRTTGLDGQAHFMLAPRGASTAAALLQ